ncbi:unnamed protein product [Urochloa humidicola]
MPNSSGSCAVDATSKTTIFAETVKGPHVLELKGYSGTKGLGVGKNIYSGVFGVAGHKWLIAYCPDGFNEESANYISVFVNIDQPVAKADVKARFGFSLLNHAGEPVPKYTLSTSSRPWGYRTFIERKELDLQQHLGELFASKEGGDVTFEVDGKLFIAHQYILACIASLSLGKT